MAQPGNGGNGNDGLLGAVLILAAGAVLALGLYFWPWKKPNPAEKPAEKSMEPPVVDVKSEFKGPTLEETTKALEELKDQIDSEKIIELLDWINQLGGPF